MRGGVARTPRGVALGICTVMAEARTHGEKQKQETFVARQAEARRQVHRQGDGANEIGKAGRQGQEPPSARASKPKSAKAAAKPKSAKTTRTPQAIAKAAAKQAARPKAKAKPKAPPVRKARLERPSPPVARAKPRPPQIGRDWSATLFLPKTDFPMKAGLPEREPELLKRWAAASPLRPDARRGHGAGEVHPA